MNLRLAIPVERLSPLMPMHMLLDEAGVVMSCGLTLRKMIGAARRVEEAFDIRRAAPGSRIMPELARAAQQGRRVFLALKHRMLPTLRGEVTELGQGALLLNLGLGIGVIEAISAFDLTDADFAADDLAIEILYLHKSNQMIRAELSRHSQALEQARETAETQAFTDALTGLLNRRGFELAFESAIRARNRGEPGQAEFALMQLDLDWFKQINDRFGHPAGDAVLCRVADILRKETRAGDSLARIGGDEFLILLPDLQGESALHALGRRIISAIREPIWHEGNLCRVSASIGAVRSTGYEQCDSATLIADVDSALYAAKHAGRGCLRLFDAESAAGLGSGA
ncbi:GGDEF domain-containing protein [Paracoccus jeotgali]|uniref:GGDEF domain-containing protein n=1 Tax=Paracoccus jeotgali TaxID=2065379 RepID=UPI0028AC5B8D|nr:GGDEF domain-containing protein [Paracoccus jeotgali]